MTIVQDNALGSAPPEPPSLEGAEEGDLLEGWNRCQVGELAQLKGGFAFKSQEYKPDGIPVVRISNVKERGLDWTDVVYWSPVLTPQVKPYLLNEGDVLISMTGNVGVTCQVKKGDLPALLNQRVGRFQIHQPGLLGQDFLFYLTQSRSFRNSVSGAAFGAIQQNVSGAKIELVEVAVPPLPEQRAIAGVLRTVQGAKEACERVLAATCQLKQSLLHHLFTYGPVPFPQAAHVPLKETEIGPICEHWKLVPCESLCEMLTVGVVVKPSSYYVASGVPAFRSFNVREDRLVTNDLVFFSNAANDGPLSKSRLREGDVLIVRTGYPGTSCVVPKEYDGANCIDLVIARPNRTLVRSEFLSRFFNSASGKQQAHNAKVGLAQQHLNVGAVRRTLVPLPPLPEQREIAAQLAAVDVKLAAAESRRSALAALFQSLLHHLMTGQVRLPEFAGSQA